MITHIITRYERPAKEIITVGKKNYPKFTGQQGTIEHRQYLHKRGLFFNPFEKWQDVKYRNKKFFVYDIYEDFHYVSWVGLSPKFIELMDNQGETYLVNPGEIKKVK